MEGCFGFLLMVMVAYLFFALEILARVFGVLNEIGFRIIEIFEKWGRK